MKYFSYFFKSHKYFFLILIKISNIFDGEKLNREKSIAEKKNVSFQNVVIFISNVLHY